MKKETKTWCVSRILKKHRRIINRAYAKKNYELVLETAEASGYILSNWNQVYADDFLEEVLLKVSGELSIPQYKDKEKGMVLFYDGVGLDTRGLMLIYITALLNLGYQVVYIVDKKKEGAQKTLIKNVNNRALILEYYDSHRSRLEVVNQIADIFNKYKPEYAFLYSVSVDVAAAVAFERYKGITSRYYITLSDHGFYLGNRACDYHLEFRDYGIFTSIYKRNISKEKLIKLPYYPFVDTGTPFAGFSFDTQNKKIVFSGGSLYKTYDSNDIYYKIVRHILDKHSDTIFVYAAQPDPIHEKKMQDLIEHYPQRVYLIPERKDLYALMQQAVVYLDTYPIGGGLMVQYAAAAGTFPLIIERDGQDGLLMNTGEKGIMLRDADEVCAVADRIISDSEYRANKEKMLSGTVLTSEEFEKELKKAIENKKTSFKVIKEKFNIAQTEEEYINNFNVKANYRHAMLRDESNRLLKYYPVLWIEKKIFTVIHLLKMLWEKKDENTLFGIRSNS
ncbi:MAG: hypothetical protein MR817_06730 [Lachnospiraceae bacterium]|nr:hypothetical protein [Lachnospiraceae bacterium]